MSKVIAGLSGHDLVDEKRRDYRNAVFLQVVIVVMALTVSDFADAAVVWYFFLAALAVYLYLLWDMLRNFTPHRWLERGVLGVVVLIYATTLVVNHFMADSSLDRITINLVLFGLSLGVQLLVIGHALLDLFDSPRNTVDKLWGSACIYFMTGIAFGCVFHMLNLLDPGIFGEAVGTGHAGFFEAIYLSFNSLVGLDTDYPDASHLLRNLTVVEGIWGQLYLVLLIGRVLMPPQLKSDDVGS